MPDLAHNCLMPDKPIIEYPKNIEKAPNSDI